MSKPYIRTDYELRDNLLKDWLGRRLAIKGTFEKKKETQNKRSGLVVLVQEIEIDVPGDGWRFLGHMWLQHAEELEALQNGDRFSCTCRVSKYTKRLEKGNIQTIYNMVFPEHVRLATGPSPPVHAGMPIKPPKTHANGLENGAALLPLLAQGKRLAYDIGPEKLKETRDFLKELGSLEKLEEFLDLVKGNE